MERTLVRALLAVACLGPVAYAQSRDEARARDLQRLEEDVANLDEALKLLEPSDPKADALRQRAEEIREETIYLKVKSRRHRRAGGDGSGISYDEVVELRRAIRDLRDDVERSFGRSGTPRELRLEEGTRLQVRLDEGVSSKTARREDRIEASVFRPVMVGTTLAVPAGTRVRALVKDVQPAERPAKAGRLELDFDALYLERSRLDLRARIVSLGDDDGRSKTAEKAGIGAAIGGVGGAILGGKQGAIVGILAGGTGAVVGTKGEEVVLPAGTVVTIALERSLVVPREEER